MAVVTVINEEGQEVQYEPQDSSFQLVVDGTAKTPAVTQTIEVESNQRQAKTGTQCGETRQSNIASDPFKVTVQGIVTNATDGTSLSVSDLLFEVQEGDFVTINSDFPITTSLEVTNVVVTQSQDLVSVDTPQTDGFETAFTFQLQLGAEQSSN